MWQKVRLVLLLLVVLVVVVVVVGPRLIHNGVHPAMVQVLVLIVGLDGEEMRAVHGARTASPTAHPHTHTLRLTDLQPAVLHADDERAMVALVHAEMVGCGMWWLALNVCVHACGEECVQVQTLVMGALALALALALGRWAWARLQQAVHVVW